MTPQTTGRTIAVLVRGIGALAVLLALVAGVPVLLVAMVGNPIAGDWTWKGPLGNDAILAVVAVLAWIIWAQLVLCVIIEVAAELRIAAGRSADWMSTVPGTFSGQQALARTLVQAVLAVAIASTAAVSPAGPWTDRAEAATTAADPPAHEPTAVRAAQQETSDASTDAATSAAAPAVSSVARDATVRVATVKVAKGDSLWSIAEHHLGNGERWREISDLNQSRVMADGQRFTDAGTLQPGWTLHIPQIRNPDAGEPADAGSGATAAPAREADAGSEQVTVEAGDTLWGLSEEAYGVGQDWPRILENNRARIEDPDLIFPGQHLNVPKRSANPARARPPSAPQPDASPHARTPAHPRQDNPPAGETPPTPGGENAPGEGTPTSRPVPAPESAAPRSDAASSASPTSSPKDVSRGDETPDVHDDNATSDGDPDQESGSMTGLLGAGALLAAGLFAALMARRRSQFRSRRSGRTIASTPPELAPTEGAIRAGGTAGGQSARFLDHALRDLAARAHPEGFALPEIVAARVGTDTLDLIATQPLDQAPPPWQRSPDGSSWSLSRDVDVHPSGALAPYPTLVAIGLDDHDATWLLDLEAAGIIQLTGDDTACADLIRFVAAELATNNWADDIDVVVCRVATELTALNPNRLTKATDLEVDRLTKAARRVREATGTTGLEVLTGRVDGHGGDTWIPTILLADTRTHADEDSSARHLQAATSDLADELAQTTGRSTVAFATIGSDPQRGAVHLTLNSDGRLDTPWTPRLITNRLTLEESHALAQLFAQTDPDANDEPMPPALGPTPVDAVSDAAGAIRPELTEPRHKDGDPSATVLADADRTYVTEAATTTEDLEALSPHIDEAVCARVLAADPDLDADLAEWSNPESRRPRLRLLGPVELHVAAERPYDVQRRVAYYTELVAYLATRPQGVPPAQMAEAFNIQTATLHSRINVLRKWLGTDETTGTWYLPESTLTTAAKDRGVPVYQLTRVLSDADLFKRLRTRGQARGADGITDLVTALELVAGAPFDQHRSLGYGWLAEAPVDHYLTAGIVDVAHIVATHALTAGDPQHAIWAAQQAILAAPSEDKPRLDLARAQNASGNVQRAEDCVMHEVLGRSDDHSPPPPPSQRTAEVLRLQDPV